MQRGFISNDGFIFTALNFPMNSYDALVVRNPQYAVCQTPALGLSNRSFEEHMQFIEDHRLDKSIIIAENIEFMTRCPYLKYVYIIPADTSKAGFDFSPLYEMPEIKDLTCDTVYGKEKKLLGYIDYSKINGLISLGISSSKGELNYNKIETLRSLNASNFKGEKHDLTDMFCSRILDTLQLIQCGVYSLNGLETSKKMQCLYLYYNRSLQDISALSKIKGTLKALRIENCPNIKDFSVLSELENLELLQLSGKNVLPSLNFLKTMKNLKTFTFNMNVQDGDLSPCLNLSYVYSEKNRKHYNLKDKDLPKQIYVRGNEGIEEWRRLE